MIQNALNRHGAGLDPDGDFGTHTRDAVIAFQREQRKRNPRFGVDGEVGPETPRRPLPAGRDNGQRIRDTAEGPWELKFGAAPAAAFPLTLSYPRSRWAPRLREDSRTVGASGRSSQCARGAHPSWARTGSRWLRPSVRLRACSAVLSSTPSPSASKRSSRKMRQPCRAHHRLSVAKPDRFCRITRAITSRGPVMRMLPGWIRSFISACSTWPILTPKRRDRAT